jgi:diguanylate cyclase (GGDEF)-like protein
MRGQTWLCDDDMARERMLDMERHMIPMRRATMGLVALALVACGPWVGWWTLAPVLIPAVGFALAERQVDKLARPEYLLFAAWMGGEITIATAVGLSGGPKSPGITWLAIPVVVLSSRFSIRGVLAGVGLVLALLVTVSFAADAHAVLHDPPLLVAPAALIVAVAMLSTAIRRADLEHRRNALIDPLTGLLNRKALLSRVEELAQLSGLTREPVGLIVADLDRFKRVNDTLGHAAGDAVLTDVAQRMRGKLRAFDLAYRVGGEEFLVLLPGADAAQTRQVAEELRVAVEAEPVGDGVAVTISLGVGASERGAAFEYDAVFAAADLALYEAKHGGRNQVRGGDLSELVVA